jgi:hypothetical protein
LFPLSERRFRARAFDSSPGALGDVANQFDFQRRPGPRCCVVGAEGGHQASALHQRDADERCDLARLDVDPLLVREPRIASDVVHHNRLAAPIRIPQRRPECARRAPSQWCHPAHVLAADDVHAIFDFRVADTVHGEMLAEQPRGDLLHVERIADRPECIGELEQEGIPLFTRAQRVLAERGVDKRSDEADDVSMRVAFRCRLTEDPADAAVGQAAAEVGLPRGSCLQRRLDAQRNPLAIVGIDQPFPAELPGVFGGEPGQRGDAIADIETSPVDVGSKNAHRQDVGWDQQFWIMHHGCGV